jgi:soluble lytic murein transglycosylase
MRFLVIFLPLFLFSLNLSEILTHPKSYVRDFYLTEFMKRTNSSILAFKAYEALYKKRTFKHVKILARFDIFKGIYKCVNVKKSYLKEVDISCILNNGLSLKTIASLSRSDLEYLYNNLPNGKVRDAVRVFLYKKYKSIFSYKELAYYVVLSFPNKRIDQYIPKRAFKMLRDKIFYKFVKTIVLNDLPKMQASLLKINYKKYDDKTKWWLFLNAMKNKHYKLAKKIILSIKKRNSKIDFWRWKVARDVNAFWRLVDRERVDFYTLYAHEVLNKDFIIKRNIIKKNIKTPKYNQTNPWDVLKFFAELKSRKDLFKFARELDSYKSIALKTLVLDKAYKYKYNFFIAPPMYKSKNKYFQAFVYAIARQESRFIPASVSRSYALGTMQIMPFLVKDLGGNVFRQFNYKENIRLGVKHLRWLFKRLKDPLMVAYAYNGGIGFVKRKVLPYFKYKGKYEPFLSMELVKYSESREYGKKVLANYVIYSHLFGKEDVSLHKLFLNKMYR